MSGQSEPHFDKSGNTGFRHLLNATRFSIDGIRSAFANESAFRQELLMFLFVLPSGAWFAPSVGPFVALLCACLFVLVVELLNSGIEATVDRVGLEHHHLAKQAKDYGSAAVMMSLIIVAILWLYVVYIGLGNTN